MQLGVPTRTGRIYPSDGVRNAVAEIEERISKRQCLITLYNGADMISLTDVVGVVTKAMVRSGCLWIDGEILGTPKGQPVREIVRRLGMSALRITPQGTGTVRPAVTRAGNPKKSGDMIIESYSINDFVLGIRGADPVPANVLFSSPNVEIRMAELNKRSKSNIII